MAFKSYIIIFLAFFASSCELQNNHSDFYLAPNGNDKNRGTIDEPVASLDRAAQLARNLKSTERVNIWLAEGVYRIEKPLLLGLADSNVKWQAKTGEEPVISGGKVIENWTEESNGLFSAKLDGDARESIRELFVNKKRTVRSRHPNKGYLNIHEAGEDGRTNFTFNEGDIPFVGKVGEIELVFLHDWSISRIDVKSIDWNQKKVTAVDWIGAKSLNFFHLTNWEKHPRYYLENAIEFVDSPGEWFYNNADNKMYYSPKPGETIDNIEAVIPIANQLIQIVGNRDNREKVKNITFEGIAFEHTSWQVPENGYGGVQACFFDNRTDEQKGWNWVSAAIELDLASDCYFNNCKIRQVGGSGIWFREETENCGIRESHIYDISGNGVNVGEGRDRLIEGEKWWKSAPEQVTKNTEVSNCLIEACGQQFYGAVGIWGGLVAESKITRNEIRNLPYTGISMGWMWSPEPTPCRENVISGNHIHHIMNKLSDGGGIYYLGLQPKSIISNNLIHDVRLNTGRAESNGMFLDEGIKSVLIENNIVYNIAKSPLRFHKASTNIVRNNILVCGEGILPIRYNSTKEEDIHKIGNVVLQENGAEEMNELNEIIKARKLEFGPVKQFN